MATVNFSVPEDIKKKFNETFFGRNKSAIIAELMEQAVEEEHRRQKRARAIGRILKRRSSKKPVNPEEILAAREELRS